MLEFAGYTHDPQFHSLFKEHLPTMAWLPYSLVNYLQQFFSACTPAATKPANIRAIINGSPISPQLFQTAETFWPRIMDILQGRTISGNMGLLATQPDTYILVFFSAAKLFFAYGLGNALTFPLSVSGTSVLSKDRPTCCQTISRPRFFNNH